jgi:hypothetical protein
VSTWCASATTGVLVGLTSPSDMLLLWMRTSLLAGQRSSASARCNFATRTVQELCQRRIVVWQDAGQSRTDVQNRYMSQFRVKGSAVRLVAAGALLKLLAEDSGNSWSVQVELRVCCY